MWRLIFGDGSWVTAPILRPCACLQHPSLYSSLGGGSLLSEHLHQDHLTPTGAKPLGNAKASWPQTGWATCSVISKCLGGGGGCHTNSSRRTCRPPSASGWLRSALWRLRVERWMLLTLVPAKVSLGAGLGAGKELGRVLH